MHLCILEADSPAADLRTISGSYADMFETWLAPALPEARFSRVAVHAGEIPEPPGSPGGFDGYLITGSLRSAYDDLDWIHGLRDFIRRSLAARVPVGGVCFGHQIIAEAMGGRVMHCERGWALGRTAYGVLPAGQRWFGQSRVEGLAFHRDQVAALPPDAVPLAGNPHCPWSALAYSGSAYSASALSVQFHPEFSTAYLSALIARNLGEAAAQQLLEAAPPDLSEAPRIDAVTRAFVRMFRGDRLAELSVDRPPEI